MATKLELERVAFSPAEFATLFGKSQTWGYRQIYAGKVKTITEHGRILIPAAEVERILGTAGIYDGMKPKAPQSKEQLQKLAPKLEGVWQTYIQQRRQSNLEASPASTTSAGKKLRPKQSWIGDERRAALSRLPGKNKPTGERSN